MKVSFSQKYKSINTFTEIEIPEFSVFVGKNGSGKTHLLQAIKAGSVKADSFSLEQISYFNFQNFLIRNQKNIAPRNLDDEKLQAWNFITGHKANLQSVDQQIRGIVGARPSPYSFDVPESQKTQYEQIMKNFVQFINNQLKGNLKIAKLVKTGIIESGKYACDITQAEFIKFSSYNPDDYELLESLSEVFIDYQKKLVISGLAEKDGGEELTIGELQKIIERAPWNFVNTMFKEFGLPHSVTFPKFNATDLINSQSVPFQVKLNIDGEEIDFDDLSSGEKILCALAITVYQDNKSRFPKVLLLDEIDASLHPSMIKNLLSVIQNIFIKNGCNVILATHSPTTAALVDENSLFEIQKGKTVEKIKKITQTDAVAILSEGFMTLEKGIKIFDALFKKDLTIISEGKNYQHINKALEVLDKDLLTKIQFYEHDSGSGDADLLGLFEFIKKANIAKKVLFVWDCDSKSKVDKKTDGAGVLKFCFEKNSLNTICSRGIENLFPSDLFTDDVLTEIQVTQSGKTSHKKEFQDGNKNGFLEKIKIVNDPKAFTNFSPLVDKVKELISAL